MYRQTVITLIALGAVTLCPFNCAAHKADRAGYFLDLVQASQSSGWRIVPPAPPRCQNETGCVCQGVVFVPAPQIDALDLDVWCDVAPLAVAATVFESAAACGHVLPADEEVHPPAGRALRALIASLQI